MQTNIDNLAVQRRVLERLAELSDCQEQALNAGDMIALTQLSELRAQVVRDAAASLPPFHDWHPEVAELATFVKARSEDVQRSLRACMLEVRRELVALTERRHVAGYLAFQTMPGGAGRAPGNRLDRGHYPAS
ncbi:MAG TPA: hypothetical protein VFE42_24370 [Chloroflexota bacterium]|jgi:hypothetical protein|nr:hypothetical protein [Chloroflexota bacterium]